ncbi:MBL fold metallo-hydrolase [Planctomycetota bacterium]
MSTRLQWLGHASFKIFHEDKVIYVDPWQLEESPQDAAIVLVSHSHYDHYSTKDIAKVSSPETKLISTSDVLAQEKTGESLLPGSSVEVKGIVIKAVPAYNPKKQFHPKTNNWIGFIIELGNKRIYYAGDTDVIEEMKTLGQIDLALLPVGGTYTMDAKEAAEAVTYIKPGTTIPYHWGEIVGQRSDAENFARFADCAVTVLSPGEKFHLD